MSSPSSSRTDVGVADDVGRVELRVTCIGLDWLCRGDD
jgi:hypothetical protein